MVPINIVTAKNVSTPIKSFFLDSKSTKVVLEDVSADTWIKFNLGAVGYYR